MVFIVESEPMSHLAAPNAVGVAWKRLLCLGATMTLIGAVAIAASIVVTLITVVFLGIVLCVGGALQMIHAITCGRRNGHRLDVAAGLVYLIAGLIIFINPESTAIAFASIFSLFLVAAGVFRLAVGVLSGPTHPWLILRGALNLMLAYVIWHDWPVAGLSIIGLLIGLELLGNGVALAMLAIAMKRMFSHL